MQKRKDGLSAHRALADRYRRWLQAQGHLSAHLSMRNDFSKSVHNRRRLPEFSFPLFVRERAKFETS